jgi:hypothetical protein
MVSVESKKLLGFLSQAQKEMLNDRFLSPVKIMPHELMGPLGITYAEALSILVVLRTYGYCQLFLLVYHECEPDLPIISLDFDKGFIQLPWECVNCQEWVTAPDEITYSVMAITDNKINFI